MPHVVSMPPQLLSTIVRQDQVVHVDQLHEAGMRPATVRKRIARGTWRRLLPGVVSTFTGEPSRRQRLVAAWLWGGPRSAIDGADACAWHGVMPERHDRGRVHIVVPYGESVRTHDFVVVRRTIGDIVIGDTGLVPYVDLPTALIVAARNSGSFRDAIGILSRGLQASRVDVDMLRAARMGIGDKWCRGVDSALVAVGVGLRSPAEKDFQRLVATSLVLPEPVWNAWLDLGDGEGLVCVDGLIAQAGLVSEVNGRKWHAWGERFEQTERRRARLVAAGLVTFGCTPSQIRTDATALLNRLERTYALHAGRGLPTGVRVVDPLAIARYVP